MIEFDNAVVINKASNGYVVLKNGNMYVYSNWLQVFTDLGVYFSETGVC